MGSFLVDLGLSIQTSAWLDFYNAAGRTAAAQDEMSPWSQMGDGGGKEGRAKAKMEGREQQSGR